MNIKTKVLLSSAAITLALATSAQAVQFIGAGVGLIPDRGAGGCGPPAGPALSITFPVAGLASNVSNVGLRLTGVHTWVGDLAVTLTAPPPGSASFTFFGATGSTTAAGCGDSTDFAGPYNFNDGFANTWWSTAAALGAAVPMTAGNYSASSPGGAPGTGTLTSINAVFMGLTPAQANGTWTLAVTDQGGGDTGSIDAAILFINETAPVSLQNFSVD